MSLLLYIAIQPYELFYLGKNHNFYNFFLYGRFIYEIGLEIGHIQFFA